MKKLKYIKYFILILFISSCTYSDEIDSFKTEDTQSYNQKIAAGHLNQEKWTETPLLIVNELLSPQYQSEGNHYYNVEIKKNSNKTFIITVTEEGLNDDSVYGKKRIIDFVFRNNSWSIAKIKVGYKCRKNRGHENYSGTVCN